MSQLVAKKVLKSVYNTEMVEAFIMLTYKPWCHVKIPCNPYRANLISQPLEVVSRYREPQLQVAENYSYLFSLAQTIYKHWSLNTHFVPNDND